MHPLSTQMIDKEGKDQRAHSALKWLIRRTSTITMETPNSILGGVGHRYAWHIRVPCLLYLLLFCSNVLFFMGQKECRVERRENTIENVEELPLTHPFNESNCDRTCCRNFIIFTNITWNERILTTPPSNDGDDSKKGEGVKFRSREKRQVWVEWCCQCSKLNGA